MGEMGSFHLGNLGKYGRIPMISYGCGTRAISLTDPTNTYANKHTASASDPLLYFIPLNTSDAGDHG
jgi:hypothetical protein